MQFYDKLKNFCNTAFKPVTIMFIPHNNTKRAFNINIPAAGILISLALSVVGLVYVCSLIPDFVRYQVMESRYLVMEKQIKDTSRKIADLKTTLISLKKAEKDLHRLISLGTKDKILEKVEVSDIGDFDIDQVEKQIEHSMQTVSAIRDYLQTQKDIYMATPKGLPVEGRITSHYGERINPISGHSEFHRGIDISAGTGTPVKATADGVVSFAGWSGGGGNVVVIAHGHGFETFYAHNSKIVVTVGQHIRRGQVISYTGSTGSSTGSHCHYVVLHNGKGQNPLNHTEG
ncbi:MAG: Murein DD-endopeptidase MepM [Syntrophus sp. PtaB.Bin001]|nr:MAG: Murein DD-endopeptidase MepM [Syntrophus sp. PtaB.Bin001]